MTGAAPKPARQRSRRRARTHRGVLRRFGPMVAALLAVAGMVALYVLLLGGDTRPAVIAPAGPANAEERTALLRPIRLPADHGVHVSATEWWYYSGELAGPDKARFSLHVAVFLRDGMVRHTVFHASLVDQLTGKRYARQLRTAGIPSTVTEGAFDFRHDGWRVAGGAGEHTVTIDDEDFSIALVLNDAHPPMLHRAAGSQTPGLLDFGDAGISYYYSRPRMAATGQVRVGGKPAVPVEGSIWFDHQWGDFEGSRLAWNWFALQLDDGSDLMIYQLYDVAGAPVMTAGSWRRNGKLSTLGADAIALHPQGVWQSPSSGVRYPAAWRVALPPGEVLIEPLRVDSEFDALVTTFNHYWEGPVRVSGALSGSGFLEMSGYDHIKAVQPAAK